MKIKAVRWSMRAILLAGCIAGVCAAQINGTGIGSGTPATTHPRGALPAPASSSDSPLEGGPSPFPDTGKQKRNSERQRRLVEDTEKLVALTAQLKAEVEASGAEAMTPEMLKQMDDIQKLAKSVKDKMRD